MQRGETNASPLSHQSQRRSFITGAAAALLATTLPVLRAQDIGSTSAVLPGPSRAQLAVLLRKLLVTRDEKLYEFATDAFVTCVLGKLRAADPPLAHAWIVPGGGYYAQWLWDTMFVVDLLSLLPGQRELIRGVFQNYWDFQERWNAAKPNFMHGMIANFMAPYDAPGVRDGKQWRDFPAYSQAPLLGWGMLRVYRRNGDLQMLREGLSPLEAFHEWYWRERDPFGLGLVGVGSYSGDAQHARYETYDREVDLDGLNMVPHPDDRSSSENGPWYGDIAIPANSSYLLLSEQALAKMASLCGQHAMAKRRMARFDRGVKAMREHMWDETAGCFVSVRVPSLEKVTSATVGGFMPLLARAPTAQQARTMAARLGTDAWATPLPVPTVSRSDLQYSAAEFWRGDVWPAPNYQIATGLSMYGLHDAAARVADATVSNALKAGIAERYDSLSGAPLGAAGLGMSSTVLTMMLDGLTSQRFQMRVRNLRS